MNVRRHHLWLLAPFLLQLAALPLVNRVEPVLLGLPFLFFWLLVSTVLTPFAVWLARRGDRRRTDRAKGRAGA
ncbi:DUF3311 domain-containing protein [Streptomyces minutiscleroticus]|uniref:DUF3311 domain-containing protein n=1 Tax=Streptomyces minutiscleroticus TaxID=68238 RepID=A0A918KKC6_9ACTN|nr:DUF3311 domain-containing protein [Streptomyces minutiscleroticus]GGX64906.1 hypothetical protein GCM10010358_19100 [Streptomyces minutiscleroticus]